MKTNIYLAIFVLFITMSAGLKALYDKSQNAEAKYRVAITNQKAAERSTEYWRDEYGREHSRNIQFVYTADEFKHSQDSLTKVLYKITTQTNKLKNIVHAGIITSKLDTVYNTKLQFAIPDTTIDFSDNHTTNVIAVKDSVITSKIGFKDTLSLLWMSRRETINPPKRWWVQRIFQKKHTLTTVETIHSNPRVNTKEQKFILNSTNKKATQ